MSNDFVEPLEPLPGWWQEILQKSAELAHTFTVPLYLFDGVRLHLDRTGVLFQNAGRRFVITAAHDILATYPEGVIPCFAHSHHNQVPIPLSGATVHYTESEDIAGVRDVAAILLSDEQIDQLPAHFSFLSMPDVGVDSDLNEGLFMAFGYPCDSRWYRPEDWANPTPLPYLTDPVVPENSSVFDSRMHLALRFNRTAVHLDTDVESLDEFRLPKISGMSGCGIWKIASRDIALRHWDVCKVRLVGIQHRCKHDEFIMGTKFGWVLQRLRDEYAEIDASLGIAYRRGY